MSATTSTGVALYGLGTVGTGLAEAIAARAADVNAGHGLEFALRHAVVRDLDRPRTAPIDHSILTADLGAPLEDAEVDVVVEVMGGLEPAGEIVRRAIAAGKDVVTANKALIAAQGPELEALAETYGVALRYEAAVGGAIPVLHALRGAFAANRITRISGIVNGTTNFILTRMSRDDVTFDEALATAQSLGYAEADPTADISGLDAAQKLVILARHAFGRWVPVDRVALEGIEHVTARDVADAKRSAGALKLVAEARLLDNGELELSVGPAVVPAGSPLSGIDDEMNAVLIEGDFAGPILLAGRGAGARPTASAVYADLVEVARLRAQRVRRVIFGHDATPEPWSGS